MTDCNCECHKKDSWSKLKKCQDEKKQKEKQIEKLNKKLLALTICLCVLGTLIGREGLQTVAEYFEAIDKVKQGATDLIGRQPDPNFIEAIVLPSPATLPILALLLATPTKRRK